MKKQYADMVVFGGNVLIFPISDKAIFGQKPMNDILVLEKSVLVIDRGVIIDILPANKVFEHYEWREMVFAENKVVMPGFVDPHTHAIFAGTREKEFIARIKHGKDYMQFLQSGSGILETVRQTRNTDFGDLRDIVLKRLNKFLEHGTTTVEIKTGYGLSYREEERLLKILYVIAEVFDVEVSGIDIVSTFLGAHAFLDEDKELYISEILVMLEFSEFQKRAYYCDVFCEKDVFEIEDTKRILEKAQKIGYGIKLHAGEFNDIGGVELGVQYGATSVDHCDHVSDAGIEVLAKSDTIAVLLPVVPYHLMTNHYAPARKMIDAGVKVALGTDFNPGSAPCMNMQTVIELACRQMKMTPEEAIIASTINAAYAIGMGDKVGSIEVGKQADIIILDVPDYRQIPYWIGGNLVGTVIKKGEVVVER